VSGNNHREDSQANGTEYSGPETNRTGQIDSHGINVFCYGASRLLPRRMRSTLISATSTDGKTHFLSLQLTFYFEEREPVEITNVKVAPERSRHIRINELKLPDGRGFPAGLPYSLLINSDVPVVIQMSRLDTTQTNMSFLSTMAYPLD
jgi:hypothetical protein